VANVTFAADSVTEQEIVLMQVAAVVAAAAAAAADLLIVAEEAAEAPRLTGNGEADPLIGAIVIAVAPTPQLEAEAGAHPLRQSVIAEVLLLRKEAPLLLGMTEKEVEALRAEAPPLPRDLELMLVRLLLRLQHNEVILFLLFSTAFFALTFVDE